jgi:hypothetical protein
LPDSEAESASDDASNDSDVDERGSSASEESETKKPAARKRKVERSQNEEKAAEPKNVSVRFIFCRLKLAQMKVLEII